jgi:hypothetical protein
MKDIQIFRGYPYTNQLEGEWGVSYIYQYQRSASGGGLKPDALACSKVTGSTLIETFVPSSDKGVLHT